MRVALDAMGGDFGPRPNVAGAIAALQADSGLELTLVGDPRQISALLAESGWSGERLHLASADDVIGMDERPIDALRKKSDASIVVCWKLMADRQVDAIVSAGNTGATVAAGLRTRLFLKGVKRPGIAVTLPTMTGRSVLMDVGANPSARPEHLLQYGVIGAIYAREILAIERPRIGLMNIGSEEGKGTDLYRDTHRLLLQSRLADRYAGNIEGRGLYQGDADVLICEGFVGNVVLKVSEGMAEFMMKSIAGHVLHSLGSERDAATRAFAELSRQYQHRETGGAPLLGIDGTCIICHGSSDERSICNAVRQAVLLKDHRINAQIVADLEGLR